MDSNTLEPGRPIPDFVIPGFSKSGTTTLFEWLSACPEVARGEAKEPAFFAEDHLWAQGWDWYKGRIGNPAEGFVGDGSPHYLDPAWASAAAHRMAEHLPNLKLLVVYRDPLERAISHFRHEVRRSRESTPVGDVAKALTVDSPYIRASRYGTGFAPYAERFSREQILIIPIERLNDTGWSAALEFLGLSDRPPPEEALNVASREPSWTPMMRFLRERGVIEKATRIAPRPLRRLGGRVLLREPVDASPPIETVREQLDPAVRAVLEEEWERFGALSASFPNVPMDA